MLVSEVGRVVVGLRVGVKVGGTPVVEIKLNLVSNVSVIKKTSGI